jgi:CubicO group peptidase (beta-lactamase class C family)
MPLDRYLRQRLFEPLGMADTGLDQVREVAHGHGATVNDVLLAVTAAGLHALGVPTRSTCAEGVRP